MRIYGLPLLAALVLTLNACGSDSPPATDGGRDSGDASGRGGSTGRGGAGGGMGGSTAGTGGATAGTGGATAGTGGATAGSGGATAGTGGATAGTGGATAGTGGGSAGTGGGSAGTGGGSAGTGGGSAGRGGTGGATAGTGGGSAGRGGTGGATAGTGGTGGATAGTGGGSAGRGGATAGTGGGSAGTGGANAGTGGGSAGTGGSSAGTGGNSSAGTGGSTAGTGGGTAGTGGTAGGGGTVACTSPSTCPGGPDTDCQQKACVGNFCSLHFTAANMPVTSQTAGDCHRNVCDGVGGVLPAIFDGDPPADDGNPCTGEMCMNGLPSHPAEPARTTCAQGTGKLCNGSQTTPACVTCLLATDCSGVDTICHQRVCGNQNTCGFSNATAGTAAEPDAAGNCKKAVCDSTGGVTSADDNTDAPADDGNSCTNDVCTNGAPAHPAKPQGTACSGPNGGAVCSGTSCVQCLTAATCPGTDTLCRQRTCASGLCGHVDATAGTAAEPDTVGNCHKAVCDGAGAIMAAVDNNDLPVDGNACTTDVCTNGTPSNPSRPAGSTCAADGSKACDAAAACNALTFRIVRIGNGTGGLSSTASAVFVEERRTDGSLVGTVTLPTAANGAQLPLTMSGSATSEGALSLSSNGHYLALAGYAAIPGTVTVASGTGNRVAGRIDVAGNPDTSTFFAQGTTGNNVRTAATTDGSELWIGGAGGNTAGGIWYNTLGATSPEARVLFTPNNVRCAAIFGNQLYGSSATSGFANVFSIGFGTPAGPGPGGTGQTATPLPGMPATGASPYGFAMFDLSGGATGLDTLYVADDAAGLQKWTLSGTTWTLSSTINIAGNTGFRGVAGYAVGGTVTLMASTAETTNRLVVFVDDGSGTVTGGVVATAASNTVYRGVALSPHFASP